MKKVFASLCLLLTSSLALAQSGKPTMEQTIEYIQANHTNNIEYTVTRNFDNRMFLNAGGDITGIKYTFIGSKVHVTYRYVTWTHKIAGTASTPRQVEGDEVVDVTFDLKDIEALAAGVYNQFDTISYADATEGGGPLFLIYKAANRKNLIKRSVNGKIEEVSEVWIPFNVDFVGTDHRAMHEAPDTQLFKAFDHLRKLSGAPEPISF